MQWIPSNRSANPTASFSGTKKPRSSERGSHLSSWWARLDSSRRPHGHQPCCVLGVAASSRDFNPLTCGFTQVGALPSRGGWSWSSRSDSHLGASRASGGFHPPRWIRRHRPSERKHLPPRRTGLCVPWSGPTPVPTSSPGADRSAAPGVRLGLASRLLGQTIAEEESPARRAADLRRDALMGGLIATTSPLRPRSASIGIHARPLRDRRL
jgi:hypothetical protein